MIAVVDNYDSFTYNLVQLLGELGADLQVFRNDQVTVDQMRTLAPTHIVISPGPKTPQAAGVSNDIISALGPTIPILGVCLGHECIGFVYGAQVSQADRLMHGKTSLVYHDRQRLYHGLSNPFEATRYHSLVVKEEGLPACLTVTAWTSEGEIMGLRHTEYPVEGVQFHPESVLTLEGKHLLENFLLGSLR